MNIADADEPRESLNLVAQFSSLGEETADLFLKASKSEMSKVEVFCYEWSRRTR
jgi:hypothetical protein